MKTMATIDDGGVADHHHSKVDGVTRLVGIRCCRG